MLENKIILGYSVRSTRAFGIRFVLEERNDENKDVVKAYDILTKRLPWHRKAKLCRATCALLSRGFEAAEARMSGALPGEVE